ncbi:MAG: DUF721 domain-containing protein [Candidatus Methylomirabilia bacterium]
MTDRRRSGPARVGSLLSAAVPRLAGQLVEVRIRNEWRSVMGAEFARHCQPGRLRNGTLELIVDNSPWLQEVTLREAQLRGRLARRFGDAAVRALKVTLGTLAADEGDRPDNRGKAIPTRTGREGPLSEEEARAVEAATGSIRDPELRLSLRRVLAKACVSQRGGGQKP